jgi:hypothetical protein
MLEQGSVVGHSRRSANPDGELIALGRRFERIYAQYTAATLAWAPAARAAGAKVRLKFGDDMTGGSQGKPYAMLCRLLRQNGTDAASKRMNAAFYQLEALADEIKDAEAHTLEGLGAKALVVMFEFNPPCADHEGDLTFPEDGGATESLLKAVAGLTGLGPMLTDYRAALAADALLMKESASA